jgi:hypothetical protein
MTISDLFAELKEGRREQLSEPELSWARDYERSLIPKRYKFPKKGNLYISNCDQEVEFLTMWSAPYTGGGKSMLYKGEQIWIDSESPEKEPISVYALPVKYSDLELRMVPNGDREAGKYEGFCFSIDTITINEKFDLIQEGFEKEKFE